MQYLDRDLWVQKLPEISGAILEFLSVFFIKFIWEILRNEESRDGSVGIALGYRLDDRGSRVRFPAEAGNFSLRHRVQNGSGAHPPSYPVDTKGSFPEVKRPGGEADHSPPSRAEVKNARSYTSIPQYVFMAWYLVKHRDNFTFYCMMRSVILLGWSHQGDWGGNGM
jgi:hypothetical protein